MPACAWKPKKETKVNNHAPCGRGQLRHLCLENLIQFGDHLLVEHPGLDAQHKAIFQLGVGAYEDWRGGGSLDVLRPAVDELSNLMHSHFTFEEQVLEGIGYEDLKAHAVEHQTMRDELSIVHERFHRLAEIQVKSLMAPGEAIMQFVLGLTVGHVGSSDMRYCRALAANRPIAKCEPSPKLNRSPRAQRDPRKLTEADTISWLPRSAGVLPLGLMARWCQGDGAFSRKPRWLPR
jgi:hemerythrin-like metal-binding protein